MDLDIQQGFQSGRIDEKGCLFVIEGTDGSGKQTQSDMLYQRLIDDGWPVKKISYPRYDNESSSLVKMYLRGDFGENPDDVSPYISSTFYAADRYASYMTDYREFYRNGGIVLADRYTTSNMVHQAAKITDNAEREKFLTWLWELEFLIYGIPIPDQVFFLSVEPEIALRLIQNRKNKIDGNEAYDIHEKNVAHIHSAWQTAGLLAKKYGWCTIQCSEDGQMLSIEEIHKAVYQALRLYLVRR